MQVKSPTAPPDTNVPVPAGPYAVRAVFSYRALDPMAANVMTVETLSPFSAQYCSPALGTGGVTVQVLVQTKISEFPLNV